MASQFVNLPPHLVSQEFNEKRIAHAFCGRKGGISESPFDSLNAGAFVGDDVSAVMANRARIASILNASADNLYVLKQTHSAKVWYVNGGKPDLSLEGDGLVTDKPGCVLGALGADCAPVMFVSETSNVIGIAHAGREGAKNGILEAVLFAMQELGAKSETIRAVVGPCIGPDSYEVTEKELAQFLAIDPAARDHFKPGKQAGKLMFDLPGYCIHRLKKAGVGRAVWVGHDTLAMSDIYFSHRRSSLAGDARTGRQLSVICLKA